jgi:hypothetical protein
VFRTIALGDIDLLNEIRVDDSGVVDRWTLGPSFGAFTVPRSNAVGRST